MRKIEESEKAGELFYICRVRTRFMSNMENYLTAEGTQTSTM